MEKINQLEDIIMTLEIDYLRFRDQEQFAPGNRVRQAALKGLKVLKALAKEVEDLMEMRDKLPEGRYQLLPGDLHLLEVGLFALGDAVRFAKR